jgi:hypothetical protein
MTRVFSTCVRRESARARARTYYMVARRYRIVYRARHTHRRGICSGACGRPDEQRCLGLLRRPPSLAANFALATPLGALRPRPGRPRRTAWWEQEQEQEQDAASQPAAR